MQRHWYQSPDDHHASKLEGGKCDIKNFKKKKLKENKRNKNKNNKVLTPTKLKFQCHK